MFKFKGGKAFRTLSDPWGIGMDSWSWLIVPPGLTPGSRPEGPAGPVSVSHPARGWGQPRPAPGQPDSQAAGQTGSQAAGNAYRTGACSCPSAARWGRRTSLSGSGAACDRGRGERSKLIQVRQSHEKLRQVKQDQVKLCLFGLGRFAGNQD